MANKFTNRILNIEDNRIFNLYTNENNVRSIIDSIIITNTAASNDADINLFIQNSNGTYYITYNSTILSGNILSFNKPISLLTGDSIKMQILNAKEYNTTDVISATASTFLSILEVQ
jgi:hypothetical protein